MSTRYLCIFLLFTSVHLTMADKTLKAEPPNKERPKIGLVLSGGGARGFAHVGALEVIKEAGIPIDYIAGSSMGSVIGALYAIGYTPDQLKDIIHTIDWDGTMTDAGPRRYRPIEEKRWDGMHMLSLPIKGISVELPSGLLDGQNISQTLARLTWPVHGISDFDDFPIPFACVATDLETGQPYIMRSGSLHESLRASIALPTLFTPKKMNGHILIDGGLVMNVPVKVARDMGADIIITINATSELSSGEELGNILDIMNQTARFQMMQSNMEQLELSDIEIRPAIQKHAMLDFANPEVLINSGRKAAEEISGELTALADMIRAYDPPEERPNSLSGDSIYINYIEFNGLANVSQRLAEDQLGIEPGSWVTREDIENGISRLYGLNFFNMVIYNIQKENPSNRLVVHLKERDVDVFRFGFRYENRKGASLFFNTTYRNLISSSSVLRISLGLGREPFIDGQYFNYLGTKSKFGLRSQLRYKQHYIDVYNTETRVFNIKSNTFMLNFLLYPVFSTDFILGAGFREEVYNYSGGLGTGEYLFDWQNVHIPYLLFEMDTLDDLLFPTRGHSVTIQSDLAVLPFASSTNFTRHSMIWKGFVPVHRTGSVVSTVNLGFSTFNSLPLYHRFFLGGYPGFLGYYPQEFSGDYLGSFQIGYQHRLEPGLVLTAAGNIGAAGFEWDWNPESATFYTGAGLNIRTNTRLGPVGLTVSSSQRHSLLFEISSGFRF